VDEDAGRHVLPPDPLDEVSLGRDADEYLQRLADGFASQSPAVHEGKEEHCGKPMFK
jgi:hypothetical protein